MKEGQDRGRRKENAVSYRKKKRFKSKDRKIA